MPNESDQQDNPLKPCDVLKWSQEQFKDLGELRRAFEQHMWQFPVAMLGVIALLLNATKVLDVTNTCNPRLSVVILLVSISMCVYGILFLSRLRARRRVREERMKAIEARIASMSTYLSDNTSVVTTGREVTERAKGSERPEERKLGLIATTRLGVIALAITAVALLIAIIFLPW